MLAAKAKLIMSQNPISRYLSEASDNIESIIKSLDLLTHTANTCNGYDHASFDRVHLMIELHRATVDCHINELEALIKRIKQECKTESKSQKTLQTLQHYQTSRE